MAKKGKGKSKAGKGKVAALPSTMAVGPSRSSLAMLKVEPLRAAPLIPHRQAPTPGKAPNMSPTLREYLDTRWQRRLSFDVIQACVRNDVQHTMSFVDGGGLVDATWDSPSGDVTGYTLLHCASFFGHERQVMELLQRRATLETRNSQGSTAVALASAACRDNVVQLLLHAGARPASAYELERLTPAAMGTARAFHFIKESLVAARPPSLPPLPLPRMVVSAVADGDSMAVVEWVDEDPDRRINALFQTETTLLMLASGYGDAELAVSRAALPTRFAHLP